MSIKLMALIWEAGPDKQAERFVLLALADFANDAAECYPSVTTLARKTCLSERGVRQILRALETSGWVNTDIGGGRSGCNVYRINPERGAPPRNVVPPEQYAAPRNETALNPERGAPEPSVTIIKKDKSKPSDDARAVIEAWASSAAVFSFLEYRRKVKRSPVTLTAAQRIAENLKAIFNGGGDPDDALGMAEERSWLTVKPDWYFNAKGQGNGNGNHTTRGQAEGGGDRQLRGILDAARGF